MKRLALVLLLAFAPLTAHAQECAPGRVPTAEGYCCWPSQRWSSERARCEGPPACPPPMVAEGDTCLEASTSGIATPQPPSGSFVSAPEPSYGGVVQPTQPTGPPGAFWPSSSGPPPGGLNPHTVPAVDEGIVGGGIALLGAGYVGSIFISWFAFESWGIEGYRTGRSNDTTCHDASGAFGLVPVLGSVMAAIEIAACKVPRYVRAGPLSFRRGSVGEYDPTAYSLLWTASAAMQLAGLGMIIGAILDPGTAVALDPRPGEVAIVPSGTGDGAMLSLRGAFD